MTKEEAAKKLAEYQLKKDDLEAEKKDVASDYNEKIKKVEAEMSALARMYLDENSDQLDAFDGVEEAQVITDESKLLNSGMGLPENKQSEEEIKTGDDSDYEYRVQNVFGFDIEALQEDNRVITFGIVETVEDLEKAGLEDYDSTEFEKIKGKFLLHFLDGEGLREFVAHYFNFGRPFERFGNYILAAPLEQKETVANDAE